MEAYLVLENGMKFKGKSFGAVGEVYAEIVFTTAMTGYIETLTDPSYYGQAIVQTFPLIGNYGVIHSDFESSKIYCSAYIVNDYCRDPSNFRCEQKIDDFLKEQKIVGIYGIDTRALTKVIREHGVMNGVINTTGEYDKKKLKSYKIKDAVKNASCTKKEIIRCGKKGAKKVVLYDFGEKRNIVRRLNERECDVIIVPYNTTAKQVTELKPDGIMLSNGPGDPAENTSVIKEIKKLINTGIPIFGICLGHQLTALAMGFKTEKLKYGHRGANQPVKNTETDKIYISSQNHGYAVVSDSIDRRVAEEYFVNVNDGTNEGIKYRRENVVTVQFHPEACGGPHDTSFLFDDFVMMMEEK